MNTSLAVKYRPTKFEDVVGQSLTSKTLQKLVQSGNFKHAYLLCGKSGCGKTTIGRILAVAINNGAGEIIEIDGASYGSVDNIRDILASASQPSVLGGYKIFIIDECHMLGGGNKEKNGAWSAFLKGLEDCAEKAIFIFCTTDAQRIPDTILNRVQKYYISPISCEDIRKRLIYICEQEGFTNYDTACDIISKMCNNGMRDAIAMLEQCAEYSTDLSPENVTAVLGACDYDVMFNLMGAVLKHNDQAVLSILDSYDASGASMKDFIEKFMIFCLDLTKYCLFKDLSLTSIPNHLATRCEKYSMITNAAAIARDTAEKMQTLKGMLKFDTTVKATVEVFFLGLSRGIK